MDRRNRRDIVITAGLLAAFALWTAAVCLVDVRAAGPLGSSVGLAALNGFVRDLVGVNMALYAVTDRLGLVPIGVMLAFALLGLGQWVRRGSIRRVDRSLLVLGAFYAAVAAAYLLFEAVAVNFRPVLIDGRLEASYPSSTTTLALCVLPTAAMQLRGRIRHRALGRCAAALLAALAVFMVVGRLLSGVHWFSDIVGGILLSAGLVMLYRLFAPIP